MCESVRERVREVEGDERNIQGVEGGVREVILTKNVNYLCDLSLLLLLLLLLLLFLLLLLLLLLLFHMLQ